MKTTDRQRLDWLDSMSDGRCWVARQSTSGRGYRLHNSSGGHKTVREAIDYAMGNLVSSIASDEVNPPHPCTGEG